ncbi:MAG TPA: TonB-dependent receptor [Candidatus Limnocylindrales bacterium]|nr:TonB-dependent receptor [Candidatus Limnocylindrales bacterium]
MSNKLLEKFPLRSMLTGVTGVSLIACSALAQDTNAPTVMKPTVVTGSYIPTAETVGPSPVQTLSTEAISEAGASDPLLTLKKLVPGFTGSGNYLGNVNNNVNIGAGFQAFTGQSYAQIRNLPTLVLIDGQRVVTSALSGAQAVDLNSIPLSMIERIEVLKDGASAIYGSDAIGGVINIITKKNYNGFEVGGRFGFPTKSGQDDDAMQYKAYIVGGASTEKSRFTFGAEIYHQNPLLVKDRPDTGSLGPAELQAHGIIPAVAYLSPSFPGKVQDGGGAWILAGSPFAQGRPGYNPGLVTPPKFGTNSFSSVAAYNAFALANGYVDPTGNGQGPYLPFDTTTLLNTTDFGTTSILEQDRRQFWANFEHELFPETLTLYSRFFYADNTASGQLAPSPVPFLYNPAAGYLIGVPANNPYNPFGIDLGSGGATTPRVRSRFVDSGNRTFDTFQDTYQWVGGLKGKITPDYGYDASFDYSKSREEQQTRNAINGAALNQALIPIGAVDAQGRPLSTLVDANGNNLPVYNIFAGGLAPGVSGNAPETIQALQSTLFTWGESELWDAHGVINGTPFDLPAGKLSFAAGGQFIHEDIQLAVDGLTQAGLGVGLNPQAAFHGGKRETAAGFIEVNIPVFGKDQNIPGFYDLEINAAGRYQSFDPGGDAVVPKVAVRWQPLDEQFTIRGSYNKGFIAPSIWNLFGPDFVSNPAISTPGGTPGQVTTITRANPNLEPQDSEQFGVGAVISPKIVKNLTVSADFYNVTLTKVPVADAQGTANSLNALGSASPFAPGFFFADGTQLASTAPNQVTPDNWGSAIIPWSGAGRQRVQGIDFAGDYILPVDPSIGKISLDAVANLTITHQLSTGQGRPYFDYTGTFTAIQGLIPDYTITASLTYQYEGLTFVASAHYIPECSDPGNLFPEYGGTEHGLTVNGLAYKIDSYFTIDLQLSYEFGKGKVEGRKWYDGSKFTFGVLNVSDEKPPLIPSAIEDNTDKNNYDVLGRFLYFEVSKKF